MPPTDPELLIGSASGTDSADHGGAPAGIVDDSKLPTPTMLVASTRYEQGGPGDFAHEITHNMRGDVVLYIFNDNIADRDSNHQGGGNATARPFASVVDHMYPRAAGVCTGTAGGAQENGFSKLTAEVCAIIDADIAGIDRCLPQDATTQ